LGFTGREEVSQAYLFAQEENFYYLTGHNEEGAGLIILPASQKDDLPNVARENSFSARKDPQKEKWNGVRMSPSDPGAEARTGFAAVKTFDSDFRSVVENLAKAFPNFYTILPYQKELGGYPHEKAVVDWLQLAAPQAKLKDIRAQIGAMRQIKSPGEIAFLKQAIDLSLDSHLEAMKFDAPGALRISGGGENGRNSCLGRLRSGGLRPDCWRRPKLHRAALRQALAQDRRRRHRGARRWGAIRRLLRGHHAHAARQRQVYDAPARNLRHRPRCAKCGHRSAEAGRGLLAPRATRAFTSSLHYINSTEKDLHASPSARILFTALGHHIGLDVHDPGEYCPPLQPGMFVTVEPGIYIPEENLGVRIEDDVLITESGHKLLSERLPRDPVEIEKIMAEAGLARAKGEKSEARAQVSPAESPADSVVIRSLIEKYAKSVDDADTTSRLRRSG